MPAVIAIVVMLVIVAGLAAFCVVNALRIKRHLNYSLSTFRARLEDEANSVLDGLLNRHDEDPPPSVNGSPSTAPE
jgi:hypothetical protein